MSLFVRYTPASLGGGGGGSGGVTTIGTLDGNAASADGASISGSLLYMQSASATEPGLVNTTTQSLAGNKTFTGTISASNLSGTNTGDITLGTASGLSLVGQVLSLALSSTSTTGALSSTDWNTFNGKQAALTIGNLTAAGTDGIAVTGGTGSVIGSGTSLAQHVADSTHNGYLSSADWSTFNGKQASGNYITALTGDVTASGPGSVAATLATVNSNVGSFGGATAVSTFTVNGKGLITAAGSTSIQIAESQVTNLTTDLAAKQSTTLTSAHILVGNVSNVATDVAMSGDIAITNAGVTSYSGTVPLNKGGTGQTTKAPAFDALSPMSASGDIIYGGASGTGTRLAKGSDGQVLTLASGLPSWAAASGGGTITAWSTSLTFTFAGLGTPATKNVWARRVGDTIEVRGYVQAGTVSAVALTIDLGGLTLDSSKIGSQASMSFMMGAMQRVSGTPFVFADTQVAIPFYDGSDTGHIYWGYQCGSSQISKALGNLFLGTSEWASFYFAAPILEYA